MESLCFRIGEGIFLHLQKDKGLIIRAELLNKWHGPLSPAPAWVRDYLGGKGDINLPWEELELSYYSERVLKIYRALKSLTEPGKLISYSQLGSLAGEHPRFVAYCMRINRFPLIVPCHRVVAKNGPGGFSYGVRMKLKLIEFEKRLFIRAQQPHNDTRLCSASGRS